MNPQEFQPAPTLEQQAAQAYLNEQQRKLKAEARKRMIDGLIATAIYTVFFLSPTFALYYVMNLTPLEALVAWVGIFTGYRVLTMKGVRSGNRNTN